jgi:hypothetical protein
MHSFLDGFFSANSARLNIRLAKRNGITSPLIGTQLRFAAGEPCGGEA